MKQKTFYTELAYALGIFFIAFGTALMEKADFGMSMVVAPAYVLYLKLSSLWDFVTFGMMEYTLQAVILLLMVLMLRRFRLCYLFSFVTAVIYGFILDGCMLLAGLPSAPGTVLRIALFLFGAVFCSLGVALMFRTYLAPEAYELFVKEGAGYFRVEISRFKTGYDCVSCLLAILLSFLFFGFGVFEGVRLGTVLCALFNGRLIGLIGKVLDSRFAFQDALPLRPLFETKEAQAE
ncbi:MAG: hypothetical protein E7330_04825 [Clostridiales bacterium]|nr:hypothetical protein [Clostridiales bacterium]